MELRTDIIVYFIELIVVNFFVYYSFQKILNIRNITMKKLIIILFANTIISVIGTYIEFWINAFLNLILLVLINGIILAKLNKNKIGYSIIVTLISYSICMMCHGIAVIIVYVPYKLIHIENQYLNLIFILIIQFVFIYRIFKIKRLKNGFDFLNNKLNNENTDIIAINLFVIVMLIYCLTGSIYDEITKNLLITFIILGITMVAVIQKTFVIYYKQKLLNDTIAQYEKDIKEKDKKIKNLSNEKYEISRISHEFYNRQKALELKVKEMLTETSDEIGILDRIENLTNEYSQNLQSIKGKDKLPLTNIPEIDDMFHYMQSECEENNIDFKLQILEEIYYLINNIIPKNKLETLIGDLLRNAIRAVNASDNSYKSILTIIGKKENCYELCVYDSGIEFEIETLMKLGKERATTHKKIGGNGIGFMTTFQTLKECNASLIIEEKHGIQENDYTKAVKIIFDRKCEYKICSYRADNLKEKDKENRIILEKL